LSGWRFAASAAVLIAAVSAAGFWAGRLTVRSDPAHAGRLELTVLPFETRPWAFGALSPDGQVLAAVTAPQRGAPGFVWIRRLASSQPERLAGTEGAIYPFWSPDGRELGFFTTDKLKRVAIAEGSAPFDICDVKQGRGGAWFDDGTIVFTDVQGEGLKRVSARAGGEPAIVAAVDKASGFTGFRYPVRVGQRHVLFLATAEDTSRSELRLASLDVPGASTYVVRSEKSAVYANGFLFFDRSGVAMAQRFDEETGALTGETFAVTAAVGGEGAGHTGYRHFMAGGRTIAWWADRPRLIQLTWLDRAGTATALLGSPATYGHFALSPDDRTLAIQLQSSGHPHIWAMDVRSGAQQQLTRDPWWDQLPRWHPDGTRLAFASNRGIGGNVNLYSLAIAHPDKVETLAEVSLQLLPIGWTPSGQFAWQQGVQTVTEKLPGPAWFNQRGVMLAEAGAEPRLVNGDTATGTGGQVALSPDGTTLAYARILAGAWQVCLDTFPTPHGCQPLAWSGTQTPSRLHWRADGRELVFQSGEDVFVVPIRTMATPSREKATRLFQSRGTIGLAVTRDGTRFLVGVPITDALRTITVVPNWTPDGGRVR
jgi:dipeptidyl aminopeptidase/acylaminoacyl peptidase